MAELKIPRDWTNADVELSKLAKFDALDKTIQDAGNTLQAKQGVPSDITIAANVLAVQTAAPTALAQQCGDEAHRVAKMLKSRRDDLQSQIKKQRRELRATLVREIRCWVVRAVQVVFRVLVLGPPRAARTLLRKVSDLFTSSRETWPPRDEDEGESYGARRRPR
jgi:hypothetical protein